MSRVRTHWKFVTVVALAAAALILSLTACGSSESGASGAVPQTTTTTGDSKGAASDTEQAMLDFAQCMRENGVPTFSDPVAKPDGTFGFERPRGVPDSVLDDAINSCQSELQAIGAGSGSTGQDDTDVQDGLFRLSRCMRASGIPEFPDPKPNSDLITGLHGLFENFDLDSPRVAKALQSCQSVLNQLLAPLHGGGS